VRNLKILIVSAVKNCKQCLQIASTSAAQSPPDPVPGLRPWSPLGTSVFQTHPAIAVPFIIKVPGIATH